ncbi:hypothetical protein TSA6c_17155 [Azospirillum sp. TSA6c]|uniref:hypothetical protein n=1 Tax=Azospirillum sp. TSA6c TaxID=709813 RepID=UPI000D6146A3|nr:hypothetical protein [Azospirillum sp. TSA6c]PWC48160.1 hypothetical protein TSA6c_17155 [Azospirillum sp. TSA6c]
MLAHKPTADAPSEGGALFPSPKEDGLPPVFAAWCVRSDGGREFDSLYFDDVYGRRCGDAGTGLIKHPERVLGLPQG